MNNFIKYITNITTLSESAIRDIEEIIEIVNCNQKHILIPELSKSEHLYFINKGVLRSFFYYEGKEITDWFGMENMIIGPTLRHFPIKETAHSVEVLENSELIRISFNDLERLYQKHHDIERLGRKIAIQTILHLQYKIDSLQLLSAKQRYEGFITQYPNLANRVSLGYISSYLGMNQVTLSRIRKSF
jgi:CRP-like cAMP-binding protein